MLATAVNSAGWLLREGLVLAEGEADQLVKRVLEMEIGPFALADEVGLDALEAVLVGLQATLGEERYRVCPTLTMRLEAGMSGRAAGRGFFVP
jgi:3-hydroxybutyryl-CoA dehydrogenase